MTTQTVSTSGPAACSNTTDPGSNPIDAAAGSLGELLAPSTVVVYARWWKRWAGWCAVNKFAPLPGTADTLGRFVAELAMDGTSPSAIRQAIGAVRAAHRSAGFHGQPGRIEAASERGVVERDLVSG